MTATALLGALQPPGVAAAGGDVDVHAEEVVGRLGEDLRQPGGGVEAAGRAGVLAPRALQEHQRLEHVGIDAGRCRGALDQRAPARGALGARLHPARRQRVEHVAVAGGRPRLEVGGAAGGPGVGVGERVDVVGAGRCGNDGDAGRGGVVADPEPDRQSDQRHDARQ
jgi:hypothetical protein